MFGAYFYFFLITSLSGILVICLETLGFFVGGGRLVVFVVCFCFFFFLLSYPDCASHVPPHPPNRDREVRAVRHRISFRVFLNGIKNALICIFSVILLNPKLAHLWFKTCFKFREEKINGYIFKVF